jgi:hypothetical protein
MSINTTETESPLQPSNDIYSEYDLNVALHMSKSIQQLDAPNNTSTNKQKKCYKCHKCSSKIPIYRRNIICKCGHLFCAPHSRSDDHNCSFDYKSEYKLLLEKQNNKVVASRCDKI